MTSADDQPSESRTDPALSPPTGRPEMSNAVVPASERSPLQPNPTEPSWRRALTPLQTGPGAAEKIEEARLDLRDGKYQEARLRMEDLLGHPAWALGTLGRSTRTSSGRPRNAWFGLLTAAADGISTHWRRAEGSARSLLGVALQGLGLWSEALEEFERAVQLFSDQPSDALTPSERSDHGLALRALGRTDDALAVLRHAVEDGGGTPEAHLALGQLLAERDALQEARDHVRTACELMPWSGESWLTLARVLERMGEPDTAQIYAEAGTALFNAGLAEAAAEAFDRAIALGFETPDVLALRGEARRLLGMTEQAFADLTEALARKPDLVGTRISLALVHDAEGRQEEALAGLDQVLDQEPGHVLALALRGTVLSSLERLEEAVLDLERALTVDPSLAWAQVELAETLRLAGRLGDAVDAADRALELLPGDSRAAATKGAALLALGRLDEALQSTELALADPPPSPFTLTLKAEILAAQGRFEQALQLFEQSLELDETSTWSRSGMADVLRRLGRFPEALEAAERVLASTPDDVRTLGTKGAVLSGLGDDAGALVVLDEALAISPDYLFGLTTKASILIAGRRFEDAVVCLRRAVALAPDDDATIAALVELAQSGEPATALELLDSSTSAGSAAAMAARGTALAELERLSEAESAFTRALQLDERSLNANVGLAVLHLRSGRPEKGLPFIERACEVSDDPLYTAVRGDVLAAMGRDQNALEAYDLAAEGGLERADVLLARSYVLRSMGRHLDALADIDHALQLEPSSIDGMLARSNTLFALDRSEEAMAVLDDLASDEQDDPQVLVPVAQVLLDNGRHAEAIDVTSRILDRVAGSTFEAAARGLRGTAYRATGEHALAADEYARVVELDPADVPALFGLAESVRALGRLEEANDVLYRALRLQPDDPEILEASGYVLMGLERYLEAIATFEHASTLYRTASTLADLALAYQLAEQYDRALPVADEAVRIDPDDPWALQTRGNLRVDIAEFEAAIDDLEAVILKGTPNSDAYLSLGWSFQNLERHLEARDAFAAAYELDGDLWARKGLANALLNLGEKDPARAHFEAVVADAEERAPGHAETLSLTAWCLYRLERFDDAILLLKKALSGRTDLADQFDLALILVCGGQDAAGLQEYRRGFGQREKVHPLRWRGYIHVAHVDLRQAVAARPEKDTPAVREVLQEMRATLEKRP